MTSNTPEPAPTVFANANPAAGLTIPRRFTKSGESPFTSFLFTKRTSRITNPDGSVVFEQMDVEVPDSWDQMATDILSAKYLRKAGVPQVDPEDGRLFDDTGKASFDETTEPRTGAETSARQWALRLADGYTHWGRKGGYFATPEDAQAFRDEVAHLFMGQYCLPNSPAHFNVGLYESYGIMNDPNGEWYVDPDTLEVRQSAHRYERAALNACFILGLKDELVGDGSIFDLLEREARLFQGGSGAGSNFSVLRGKGEKLSGGGVSSGLMSFLRVSDRAAGSISSGGTTRRAAKMVLVDDDHPDVLDFIWAKAHEEDKIAALVRAGFDPSWNAENGAVDAAFYQNFNGSVMLSRAFMDALIVDGPWQLRARTSGGTMKELPARELWDSIAEAAWRCADPGVMFSDIINDWNAVSGDGRIVATNPCAEYIFLNDTACNLASINLVKFYDHQDCRFDTDLFAHVVRLVEIMLEISVSMSHYPSPEIARNSFEYRTTGIGYCNLGALLMRAGLAYDSDEARAAMAALTGLMHMGAWEASTEMAAALGPCTAYTRNSDSIHRVLRNHARAAFGSRLYDLGIGDFEGLSVRPQVLDHRSLESTVFAPLSEELMAAARRVVENAPLRGVRNAFTSCVAPTGTIALVMGADTTGVEPGYALVTGKKLAGGGYMKIVNDSVTPALNALGYTLAQQEDIITFALGTGTLDGATSVNRASLAARGVSESAIEAISAALPSSFDLEFAIAPGTVSAEVFAGLDIEEGLWRSPGFSLLRHLGFSATEIAASSTTICGHHTVEGAPHLKQEHFAVFDCANYCGDGTRVIPWTGHVRALGAIAPLLSGSASKTVNMPNDATVDDVKAAYKLAYDLGVKNVAIYRDGSKGSQVLASGSLSGTDTSAPDQEPTREIPLGSSPTAFYHGVTPPRFRLPNLRFGPIWRIEVGGEELYLRAGEYPDGTLGEVFLDWGKQGSTLRGMTAAVAICISQGLQHGVPLEKFVKALRGHQFEPAGVVVGHENLKMAKSVVDAMMRVLGYYYLDDETLVQVSGGPTVLDRFPQAGHVVVSTSTPLPSSYEPPTAQPPGELLYGESCPNCASTHLRKSGSCKTCEDCGTTTGCS